MNRDETIAMAREAGFEVHERKQQVRVGVDALLGIDSTDKLERFAALVAAKEREACALVCEDRAGTVSMFGTAKECAAHNGAIDECAAAIRARGQKEGA